VINYFLNLSRFNKKTLAISFDIFLSFLATWSAFTLRLEQFHNPINHALVYLISAFALVIIFHLFKIYSSLFRYIDKFFVLRITKAISAYFFIFFIFILFFYLGTVPRSVAIIQPLILLVLIVSQRSLLSSLILNFSYLGNKKLDSKFFLIYGINDLTIRAAKNLRESNLYNIFGFINDEKNYLHLNTQEIMGIKVYNKKDLSELTVENDIKNIIFSDHENTSYDSLEKNRLIKNFLKLGLKVFKFNNLLTLEKDSYHKEVLKKIDLEDILGRKKVQPIQDLLIKNNINKNILITGGAGSIGSEIFIQISALLPKKIFILDNNEFGIYNLKKYLKSLNIIIDYEFILGDITDEIFLRNFFNNNSIDTVYHCAAYKHVPLLEKNIISCVKNNILGTYNILNFSIECKVKNFVFISTDKAVNPRNVMGVSKKFSEILVKSFAKKFKEEKKTKFSIVRFGNVLDSRGSVLPLFKEQIQNGGPVTLTDINMTRFFMTIPEAAELVIQAGGLDSDGDIYILDMGEQIKIYDLIIKLLEINNLSLKNNENPNGDIEIKIIGIRPGEKILEELIDQDGVYIDTIHSKIKRIVEKENNVLDHPEDVINKLRLLIEKSDVKNLDNFINSYKEKNL